MMQSRPDTAIPPITTADSPSLLVSEGKSSGFTELVGCWAARVIAMFLEVEEADGDGSTPRTRELEAMATSSTAKETTKKKMTKINN